jgi:hypothetical protein
MFWKGGSGAKMACPECKGVNVHQIQKVPGWDRDGKYSIIVIDDDQISTGSEDEDTKRELFDI